MADPLKNEDGATKGYVDDLFGNIVETEASLSNLFYKTGVNPDCGDGIMLMRSWEARTCGVNQGYQTACTTETDWVKMDEVPSCGYYYCSGGCANATCVANTWHQVICVEAEEPLHMSYHTAKQCEAWGGEVIPVGADNKKICRFNSGTCPSSWTQYENWSTTVPSPSAFYDDPIERISYYTGSHNWSNTPVESFRCKKCVGLASWKGYFFCGTTDNCGGNWYYSYATITQIGCY